MKLSNLYNSSKYINKLKSINGSIKKAYRTRELINNDILSIPLNYIWKLGEINVDAEFYSEISEYKIFGTTINLNNINWHKDYISNIEYPLKRFDKLRIEKWFNKGIDVKFPWEVSRFYFAIKLAQNYVITNNEKYYLKFKELILDWFDKNPFCYGVNWVCTMEVAIRAINWIVAINIFGKVFEEDEEFQKIFNKSLVQHAEYVSAFPEIYEFNNKKHTSNHTTADYAGLLFLALTLKEHLKSEKWLNQSIGGLESCIRYQTYDDGVNFEASIPYHRLVLEMFAYSAIVCRANEIDLSTKYYELLFKMFEYTAAYMDHNGNAPQVGDNDSGRILIFHKSEEHDHSYLLDLGEHIFNYQFKSQCKKRIHELKQLLPKIDKIDISTLNLKPRETDKNIAFEKGGAYFLENDNFSLMVACFPIGQNGVGGHNHYDMGSFTLSYKGQPIIVDPGTYTYTRSKQDRDKFRGIKSHNVVFKEIDKNTNINKNGIWEISKYHECELLKFDDRTVKIKINNLKNNYSIIRNFKVTNTKKFEITDECDGEFYSLIHFYPDLNTNICTIRIENKEGNHNKYYRYSKNYGSFQNAKYSIIRAYNFMKINAIFS